MYFTNWMLVLAGCSICVVSCIEAPIPEIKAPSPSCELTESSTIEGCPGVTEPVTHNQCLLLGCCWAARPNTLGQQCFRVGDSSDGFDFKISNEYQGVQGSRMVTAVADQDPPYFKIDLRGAFYSYEGEDFSPDCTRELGYVMETKAQGMIAPVNSRIGEDFCLDKSTEDILVISTASTLSTVGREGVTANSFIMRVGGNQTLGDISECATDISRFLEDFLNWGIPILTPPDGCPQPVFYDSQFENIGNNWICLDSGNTGFSRGGSVMADNNLGYGLSLSGDFVTYNSVPLDSQCTAAYSQQFLENTFQMMSQVNSLIGNVLCSDSPGMVLSTATSSLSSNDHLGYTSSSFVASLDDDMYFDWVYSCGSQMSDYLHEFENWGTPILDQVPGCPPVIFQGSGFEETEQTWVCQPQY